MHKTFAKLKGIDEIDYLLYIEDCFLIYDNGMNLEYSEYRYNFGVSKSEFIEIPYGAIYNGDGEIMMERFRICSNGLAIINGLVLI